MGDWVDSFIATDQPELRAAASEQGTEVIGVNQNSTLSCKFNHLNWSAGGIEVACELRVAIHQEAEVIDDIQQWGRGAIHPGSPRVGNHCERRLDFPAQNFT